LAKAKRKDKGLVVRTEHRLEGEEKRKGIGGRRPVLTIQPSWTVLVVPVRVDEGLTRGGWYAKQKVAKWAVKLKSQAVVF
jgi:hypothetical protein